MPRRKAREETAGRDSTGRGLLTTNGQCPRKRVVTAALGLFVADTRAWSVKVSKA